MAGKPCEGFGIPETCSGRISASAGPFSASKKAFRRSRRRRGDGPVRVKVCWPENPVKASEAPKEVRTVSRLPPVRFRPAKKRFEGPCRGASRALSRQAPSGPASSQNRPWAEIPLERGVLSEAETAADPAPGHLRRSRALPATGPRRARKAGGRFRGLGVCKVCSSSPSSFPSFKARYSSEPGRWHSQSPGATRGSARHVPPKAEPSHFGARGLGRGGAELRGREAIPPPGDCREVNRLRNRPPRARGAGRELQPEAASSSTSSPLGVEACEPEAYPDPETALVSRPRGGRGSTRDSEDSTDLRSVDPPVKG